MAQYFVNNNYNMKAGDREDLHRRQPHPLLAWARETTMPMKAVLGMIGVASWLGAACLPTFDQPVAQSTVANPEQPNTAPVQATGDNAVVASLTPMQ